MVKLTIIIPHFNSWDLLWELLDSIPLNNQIQIIVIDDHSPEFETHIKRFKSNFENVLFIKNDINTKGAGAARNKGLKIAKGQWILFADSDDLFYSDMLEKIEEYLNSNADIVYFSPNSFTSLAKVSSRHSQYQRYVDNYLKDPNQFNELKLRYYFIVPWSKLFKRSLINKNNIEFEEIMYSNDVLFSAKTGYFAENIEVTSLQIYKVRETESSLTSNTNHAQFVKRFNAWLDYILFLKSHLSKESLQLLNLSALTQFVQIKQKKGLGIKEMMYVIKQCKRNGIPLFDRRIFKINLLKKYLINASK
ncbi:glycosyltransferase family 2 protein [Aerococcus urinaeequi]